MKKGNMKDKTVKIFRLAEKYGNAIQKEYTEKSCEEVEAIKREMKKFTKAEIFMVLSAYMEVNN